MTREYFENFLSRSDIISQLKQKKSVDILVVGGGIHGAAFARLAALNNLEVVLLEQADYAQGTSSKSSKMAHGGLRYLENFDFQQVFEGVKARENLFKIANHLAYPTEFFIPVKKGEWFFKYKLGLGLSLYDLFLKDPNRKHRRISVDHEILKLFGHKAGAYDGGYTYCDGILDDTRLVISTVLSAREEGAICLNYASVNKVSELRSGRVLVSWTDELTGRGHEIEVGAVVNCAGPWVPDLGGTRNIRSLRTRLRYSQGSHVIFNKKWDGPALLLPLAEKGRYYFVWPHPAGTLVGTTEREIADPTLEVLPLKDEILEIYDRLSNDLPESGLTPEAAHYCFAGIRTLPLKKGSALQPTSKISRKHKWYFNHGVLSLVGGKLTTAYWTALEGLKIVTKLAQIDERVVTAVDRVLPGAGDLSLPEFRQTAQNYNVPSKIVDSFIRRHGRWANYFVEESSNGRAPITALGNCCLAEEVNLAIDIEQAESLEDIMQRRLGLEYEFGHGIEILDLVLKILKEKRPQIDVANEKAEYLARISTIQALLHS